MLNCDRFIETGYGITLAYLQDIVNIQGVP